MENWESRTAKFMGPTCSRTLQTPGGVCQSRRDVLGKAINRRFLFSTQNRTERWFEDTEYSWAKLKISTMRSLWCSQHGRITPSSFVDENLCCAPNSI